MKKVTLKDIATLTGLSVSTVSRILSGVAENNRISPETRGKVLKEARRLSYIRPGSIGTGAAVSNTVGLLLPAVSNPYFADLASTIISELDKEGYTTVVADTMEDERKFFECLGIMAARQVDGMIIVPCGKNLSYQLDMLDQRLPVVLIDRYYEGTKLSYVTSNNYQGGLIATRYLISKGHTRIVCIQGERDSMPNRERVRGYRDAMKEAALSDNELVVGNDFSVTCGYREMQRLIECGDNYTAVFALSNTITLGAISAIRQAGMIIPDQVAILSFDTNVYMDYMTPPITRVGQPTDDMAKLSVKMLLEKIAGNTQTNSHLLLTPTFIKGESA